MSSLPHPVVPPVLPDPDGRIAGAVLPLAAAEELVASLDGVLSARIAPTESGQVSAIHVLTDGSVPAKAMVRNVESALMARLGLKIDHRKVSIAVTRGRTAAPTAATLPTPVAGAIVEADSGGREVPASFRTDAVAPAGPVRALYFDGVEVRGSRQRGVTVRITLRRGSEVFHGEAEGLDGARSRLELAARATLAAIVDSERGVRTLVLEGVKELEAFESRFAMVGVTVQWGRERVLLAGTCEVKDSAETAAALAVLDATNRWLSWRESARP